MKILITGGTGFIGKALCHRLINAGHDITILSRRTEAEVNNLLAKNIKTINSLTQIENNATYDAVINLAGTPITDKRWSLARKAELISSRVNTTDDIFGLISRLNKRPKTLISGSAVGYYGDQQLRIVTETTPPHNEFTHKLCKAWEDKANRCKQFGVRIAILRTGLVIGSGGGFLQKMLPIFKLGIGGTLGAGTQYMPWIHLNDMVEIIICILEDETLSGPFNATAPNPVTNKQFTKTLGTLLSRPTFLTIPSFVLNLILGEMASILLAGQKAIPQKLLDHGYKFQYETLSSALGEVLTGK